MAAELASIGGEFSLWSLFLRADPVVKGVMGLLIVSSLWSWTIIIDKSMTFGRLKRKSAKFEDNLYSDRPIDEVFRKVRDKADHPMARVFVVAMQEWTRTKDAGRSDAFVVGAKQRIDKVMNVAVSRELEKAESQLGVLATIGSACLLYTSPSPRDS